MNIPIVNRIKIYVLISILLLPLSGVGGDVIFAKKKVKVDVPVIIPTQEECIGLDNARKYEYFYVEAVRQQDKENYAGAFELFRHCIEIDSLEAEAYYGIARYYAAFKQDSIAKACYEKAVQLDPQNGEFTEQLGQYYLSRNDIKSATDLYERISKKYPDRDEYLEVLLGIYQHDKDYPKMLETLNRLEMVEGQSEELTLTKMQVYSYMGDNDGAYKEISSLVKAHPNDLNYQVMMGNWLLATGKKAEAKDAFEKVLKEEPDHAQAQMSLMDYYRTEGNEQIADSLLYMMLENPKTEPSTRVTLMRQVVSDNEQSSGDSTRVLGIFSRVLQLPQKTSEMAEMQVSYMQFKKMPTDSIKAAINRVLAISPENLQARLQLIDILWRDTIDDKVIEECEKAVDYSPDSPDLFYYLGLAYYLNEKDEKALDAFKKGTSKIQADTPKEICSRMYMLMGDVLHQFNRPKESYAAYDSCLTYNPDEISCLNNYAYYLSEEGKELKKAELMSYKTIKAEPKNATYLDTYAWILYKNQRYEEAKIYIDQTLMADSDTMVVSATVLEHAGDIYNKVGQPKKAIEFYQRALDLPQTPPQGREFVKSKINAIRKKLK